MVMVTVSSGLQLAGSIRSGPNRARQGRGRFRHNHQHWLRPNALPARLRL